MRLPGRGFRIQKLILRKVLRQNKDKNWQKIPVWKKLFCLNWLICVICPGVGGVGPVFARMLYDSGIQKIGDLRKSTAEEIKQKFDELNAREGYTGCFAGP